MLSSRVIERRSSVARLLVAAGGIVLLGLSSYMLHFWLLLGLVEGGLAPWDYGMEAPPASGWQSAVNGFFSHSPGENLPSVMVFVTMAILLGVRWRRDRDAALPLEFGLLNVGFVIVGFTSLSLVMGVYRPLIAWLMPDRLQGYHVTWPTIALSLMTLLALFYSQASGWLFRRMRHKPAFQVVTIVVAVAGTWLACGPGITYQLFQK